LVLSDFKLQRRLFLLTPIVVNCSDKPIRHLVCAGSLGRVKTDT